MKEVVKPTKPHKHADYHEIIILSEGSGFHNIDNANLEVLPPVAYLLKPGQVHCWNFSKIPKGFVILFREELLHPFNAGKLIYDLPKMVKLHDKGFIFKLLENLLHEFREQPGNLNVLSAYLHLLIIKLADYAKIKLMANTKPVDDLLYNYRKMIDDSYKELKQVKEYAQRLNVTTHKLNEVSKKALGKAASDLIRERILLESKILLSHTRKSVNEIAFELQFTDASNFVKFFKSQTNITPRKYRELL